VNHVPRYISTVYFLFIRCGGVVYCRVLGGWKMPDWKSFMVTNQSTKTTKVFHLKTESKDLHYTVIPRVYNIYIERRVSYFHITL